MLIRTSAGDIIERSDGYREAVAADFVRTGTVPGTANREARTIDIVLSDERTNTVQTFDRRLGEVINQRLSLDPAHIRLDRLNNGAPFLVMHARQGGLFAGMDGLAQARSQIGKIVEGSARVEGTEGSRQLIATVLFSNNLDDEMERHVQDIFDGIRRNISVGFREHEREIREREDGPTETLAVDWEPFEGSSVTMGADPGAHFRAGTPNNPSNEARAMTLRNGKGDETRQGGAETKTKDNPDGTTTVERLPADPAEVERLANIRAEALLAERAERKVNLRQLGKAVFAGDKDVERWIGETVDEVRDGKVVKVPMPFERIRDREIALAAEADDKQRIHGSVRVETGENSPELHRGLSMVGYLLCERGGFDQNVVKRAMKRNRKDRNGFIVRHASDQYIDGFDFLREGSRYSHRGELYQLACLALEADGTDIRDWSRAEVIEHAIGMHGLHGRGLNTVSAFPLLLAEVLNTSLRIGYDEYPQTFVTWAQRSTSRDFRTKYNLTMGEADDLVLLEEKAEIPTSTIGEGREGYAIDSYGRIFGITFKLMVNDHLDGLTQIPRKFGNAGVRRQRQLVYGLITGNPALSDTVSAFSDGSAATRSRNDDATPSVFSITAADRMRVRFGRRQGIEPSIEVPHMMRHVVCGTGKETFINQVLGRVIRETRERDTSEQVTESFTGWSVTGDPLIDAHDAGGGTGNAWYGTDGEAIEYAFLSGMEGVQTAAKDDFERLGMKVRATMHFGAGWKDWRGFDRNQGA